MRDNPPGFLSSGRFTALLFFPLLGLIECVPQAATRRRFGTDKVAARINLAANATLVLN